MYIMTYEEQFKYVSFYKELADILLTYKDDRLTLISKLRNAYNSINMDIGRLSVTNEVEDIDPFTIYGLFNKGMNLRTRLKILNSLKKEFSILSDTPSSFSAVPLVHNQNSTFYSYDDAYSRNIKLYGQSSSNKLNSIRNVVDMEVNSSNNTNKEVDNYLPSELTDIEVLWKLFEDSINLSSDPDSKEYQNSFIKSFDTSMCIWKTATSKLTVGLYWIRPDFFLSLDTNNIKYIKKRRELFPSYLVDIITKVEQYNYEIRGFEYLEVIRDLSRYLQSDDNQIEDIHDFKELSLKSYLSV